MESRFDFIEIQITDFVEDPADGGAFAVNFQINGPGTDVEYIRVSFAEEFIEEYFKIVWPQDLEKNEKRLLKDKRTLFIKWAIWKVEQWLEAGRPEQDLMITTGQDMEWTKKLENRELELKSEYRGKSLYLYSMKRNIDPS